MKKQINLLIICCFSSFNIFAQYLDPTFGTDGVVYFPNEQYIRTVQGLPDGKVLVLGDTALYRLNVDGTTDVSFGNNGAVGIGCTPGYVWLMPDNAHMAMMTGCEENNVKIYDTFSGSLVNEITIITECYWTLNPVSSDRIRLLDCEGNVHDQNIFDDTDFFTFPDGLPDPDEYYRDVTMSGEEDFTITMGAVPYQSWEPVTLEIKKINDDGFTTEWTYSETFSGESGWLEYRLGIYGTLVQSDGKVIYNYGYSDDYECDRHIRRLNADGSVDTTFTNLKSYGAECGCDCYKPAGWALTPDDEIIMAFNENGFAVDSRLNHYDKDRNFKFSYQAPVLGFGYLMRNISPQPDSSVFVSIYEEGLFSGGTSGYMVAKFAAPVILPIELTDFQAKIENKTALLTWQTAIETNNQGFEIQRSKDGITWEKIGWQDGQGTSTIPHSYTYRDVNPFFGTSYYRLQQIDFDGTSSHSDVVRVNYVGDGISIQPNPVKNTLHITDLNESIIQNITIFDQTGKQVIIQNSNANTLDVSALSSGVYIIEITLDNSVFSERFVVKP